LPDLRERGYVISGINSSTVDYHGLALALQASILRQHPEADVTVITVDMLPHGDQGGQANDWQLWEISPYHETIKLEADMLVASSIDHWWTMFRHRDMVISLGCRDFRDQQSTNRAYRKIFDENALPDVYNAMTYWRVSRTAKEFFRWCRRIWQDWNNYRTLLRFSPDTPNTDLVYAMAAVIVGVDRVTLPVSYAQITHMKPAIIGTDSPDWSQELIWEQHDSWLRIQTLTQWGLFHYHVKQWQP
jgi:hypothetical protein